LHHLYARHFGIPATRPTSCDEITIQIHLLLQQAP